MRKSSLSNGEDTTGCFCVCPKQSAYLNPSCEVWSLGRSSDERDEPAADDSEGNEGDDDNNNSNEEDKRFWNLNVRANSMPLSRGGDSGEFHPPSGSAARALSASAVLQSTDDLIKRMSSAENLLHGYREQKPSQPAIKRYVVVLHCVAIH